MDIGVSNSPPTYHVDPAATARKAEALGFESIWYAEHPILPTSSASPFPGSPDGVIPESYAHFADPFISLARASATTSTIKLGTGIVLVPERNPLVLAKEIATLDLFSGGRFLFGIGAGWNREETEIMGGDFEHRWTQTREAIAVMKELWSKEEAHFDGKYYRFPPVKSFPKPARKPHPPILLGSNAKNVLRWIAAWGDGWLPVRATPADVEASRATLDTLAAEAGRDPASLTISVTGQPADRDLMRAYDAAGADRFVVRPSAVVGEEEMSRELERIADAVLA